MKLNKNNFALNLLIVSSENYDGSLSVEYTDKVFQKEITIQDTTYLSSSDKKREINEKESKLITQVLNIIKKEFNKKGFNFQQFNIHYSPSNSSMIISYLFGEGMNTIEMGLNEDTVLSKKVLTLSKSLTKRLMKELR